jgi:ABC-type uncharacterized transport system ATPase subunit
MMILYDKTMLLSQSFIVIDHDVEFISIFSVKIDVKHCIHPQ